MGGYEEAGLGEDYGGILFIIVILLVLGVI
ncbi:hypothetical protein Halha_0640 [Halobacteroides halobius DSM 5150]|uniref:Uncharacterized protein n=1 Tax=Halobacteroides halobius (strain ATCC 35273 / DSM 5150 / MD-1) TaxID=748449 RepID=L0K915_HALHC|nr:hypothetical protein Halha_0640 [Halobacteroides halobius DSM 5150]